MIPKLMGGAVGVHPLLVIFALLARPAAVRVRGRVRDAAAARRSAASCSRSCGSGSGWRPWGNAPVPVEVPIEAEGARAAHGAAGRRPGYCRFVAAELPTSDCGVGAIASWLDGARSAASSNASSAASARPIRFRNLPYQRYALASSRVQPFCWRIASIAAVKRPLGPLRVAQLVVDAGQHQVGVAQLSGQGAVSEQLDALASLARGQLACRPSGVRSAPPRPPRTRGRAGSGGRPAGCARRTGAPPRGPSRPRPAGSAHTADVRLPERRCRPSARRSRARGRRRRWPGRPGRCWRRGATASSRRGPGCCRSTSSAPSLQGGGQHRAGAAVVAGVGVGLAEQQRVAHQLGQVAAGLLSQLLRAVVHAARSRGQRRRRAMYRRAISM